MKKWGLFKKWFLVLTLQQHILHVSQRMKRTANAKTGHNSEPNVSRGLHRSNRPHYLHWPTFWALLVFRRTLSSSRCYRQQTFYLQRRGCIAAVIGLPVIPITFIYLSTNGSLRFFGPCTLVTLREACGTLVLFEDRERHYSGFKVISFVTRRAIALKSQSKHHEMRIFVYFF